MIQAIQSRYKAQALTHDVIIYGQVYFPLWESVSVWFIFPVNVANSFFFYIFCQFQKTNSLPEANVKYILKKCKSEL